MKNTLKTIFILTLFFLGSHFVDAKQIFVSGDQTAIVASSTQYGQIQGHTVWGAADTVYQIMPTPGMIDLMALRPSASPVQNATITLMVNGTPSTLTCTTNSAAICHDSSHQVAVAAGDKVSVKLVIAASASTRAYSYSMRFTPTIAGETVMLGYATGGSNTITDSGFQSNAAWQTTVANRGFHIIPETGTFKKMYLEVDTDPGGGNSITFTTRNNGSAGNVAVTITGGGALTGSDTTHSDTIATAGDLYGLRTTQSGTPTYSPVHYGIVYISPTYGNFLLTYNSITGDIVAPRPQPVSGTRGNATGYLAAVSNAFTVKSIYSWFSVAPGGANSDTVALNINTVDSALAVTVSGANTTGNTVTDVNVALDDRLQISTAEGGTPAISAFKVSMVAFLREDVIPYTFFHMFQ